MSESIKVSEKTKKQIEELAELKGQKQIQVLAIIVNDYHRGVVNVIEQCTCGSRKYYGPDHAKDCDLYLPF